MYIRVNAGRSRASDDRLQEIARLAPSDRTCTNVGLNLTDAHHVCQVAGLE